MEAGMKWLKTIRPGVIPDRLIPLTATPVNTRLAEPMEMIRVSKRRPARTVKTNPENNPRMEILAGRVTWFVCIGIRTHRLYYIA